jgi:hypothetical protein
VMKKMIPMQFYDDDILIICLLFLLYTEKNTDYSLYLTLILILLTN